MKKKKPTKIFFVDDDVMYLKLFEKSIHETSYHTTEIKSFESGSECLKNIHEKPDIIILDYYLSQNKKGINGLDTLKKLAKVNSKARVIMLSAQDELPVAVNSIKYGAFDYIVKNESAFIKVQNTINNIIYRKQLEDKARGNKLWLRIASFSLLAIVVSFVLLQSI